MINKQIATAAEALEGTKDGAVVLVGGFGQIGHPLALIDALIEVGAKDLTIVCNNAGIGTAGLPRLMKLGRVRKINFPSFVASQKAWVSAVGWGSFKTRCVILLLPFQDQRA